jgi:iodotyrosine deiodinase
VALALAGACACVWTRSGSSRSEEPIVAWRQLPPSDPDALEIKAFGETHLQARLVCNRLPARAMQRRADSFFELMNMRRTLRFYSNDAVPQKVLDACIATAGTSPSGAHHQPWYFAVVKTDALKLRIRELVEAEEKVNYERRMRKSWIEDLSSMTGAKADARLRNSQSGAPQKPYLTEAPALIAMFKQTYALDQAGQKIDNYYVNESCGIAAGFLIAALHNVGLATLTSTPMGAEQAIRELLGRPDNEKLFLLMPVGYPAKDATVPYRVPLRKPQSELSAVF